jgi:hypothetical protein
MRKNEANVWPENYQAVMLFTRLGTQWRIGMAGPTGLDYCAVLALIDRMGLDKAASDEIFEDVCHLEQAALKVIREGAE